jgi:hypothetical protein
VRLIQHGIGAVNANRIWTERGDALCGMMASHFQSLKTMTDATTIEGTTPPSERIRVGDVTIGPFACQDFFNALFEAINKASEPRGEATDQDKRVAALENLLCEVMRKILGWHDDANMEMTAHEIRVRAIQDAADLDRLCHDIPDDEDERKDSGWGFGNKILDEGFNRIDHGPLAWGWAAACEGALPKDEGEGSAARNHDFIKRAVQDGGSKRCTRVMDFVDAWPETIWGFSSCLGPQIGQESMDFHPDKKGAPFSRSEDTDILTAALNQGSWLAAELIWKRNPIVDSQIATRALQGVLQHVFNAKNRLDWDGVADDPLAPARWAQRLVRSGADINARIHLRYVGSDETNYRSGSRNGPASLPLNGRIADDAKKQGWRITRESWGACQYVIPNTTTQNVDMTLSELAAMSIGAIGLAYKKGAAEDVEGPDMRATGVSKWLTFWAKQWRNKAAEMALPWHEHGSILDVVLHHILHTLKYNRSDDDDTAVSVLELVRSLSRDEVGADNGWWNRPATPGHPWPAWEIVVQMNASTNPVGPPKFWRGLAHILITSLPDETPFPVWAVHDSAQAIIDETLRVTAVKNQSDGASVLHTVSPQAWVFAESLMGKWTADSYPAVKNWMKETALSLGEYRDSVMTGNASDIQILKDKLLLLTKVFPAEEEELVTAKAIRPRKM